MPWKEASAMSLRWEIVQRALEEHANRSRLAREFKVSRKTLYKWLRRFRQRGRAGLCDLLQRPHTSPKRTPAEMETKVLALRDEHSWGGRKISRRLRDLGMPDVPPPSTITEILRRHGRLDPDSRQGDARFLDLLRAMGCRVEASDGAIAVEGDGSPRGLEEADLSTMPDMAPTLAIVALFARGPTRIRGVPHLRLKETDRIAALVAEIRRLGGDAEAHEDGLTIRPRPLSGARVETYRDHRMAMAFAVAGLRLPGVVIADPGCVAKSFPRFWEQLDRLTSRPR